MRKFLVRYAPVLIWMTLMYFFSSRSDLPSSGSVTEDFFSKKLAHIIEYLILMLLMYRAVGEKSPTKALLYSLTYAFTDETHQLFIPYRTGNLRDVGIDAIGLLLASFSIIKFQLWNSSLLVAPLKKLRP
jgi:VanZ family protein